MHRTAKQSTFPTYKVLGGKVVRSRLKNGIGESMRDAGGEEENNGGKTYLCQPAELTEEEEKVCVSTSLPPLMQYPAINSTTRNFDRFTVSDD